MSKADGAFDAWAATDKMVGTVHDRRLREVWLAAWAARDSEIVTLEAEIEAARKNTFVAEWSHGCAGVCSNIALWVSRCPHCGMQAPVTNPPANA